MPTTLRLWPVPVTGNAYEIYLHDPEEQSLSVGSVVTTLEFGAELVGSVPVPPPGIVGTVDTTLALPGTLAGTVLVKGGVSTTLALSGTLTSKVLLRGSVNTTLAFNTTLVAKLPVRGIVSTILGWFQVLAATIFGGSGNAKARIQKTYWNRRRRR